jgi:hypothetical protein
MKLSSQVSLQLAHGLGGYIRRMCSHAPTGKIKSKINTNSSRLSMSVTPRLPLGLGGY